MDLKNYIATIEDFPIEGIKFRDITPLMADGKAFREATRLFVEFARKVGADVIVGPESRGFIFGCPVAYEMEIGFVPVRKPGKLPRETLSYSYDLEYGSNELHIHKDGVQPGQKVLIIDDLLATGGTIEAAVSLVRELGAEVVGCGFLIELEELKGRQGLQEKDIEVYTIMKY